MVITSTDFQKDIGKYFEIVDNGEEIIITVRGTKKYKLTKVKICSPKEFLENIE